MSSDLANSLKVLLASTHSLMVKTQFFHWNVTGSNFPQFHTMFGDQYKELFEAIDIVAETIRTMDFYAPGSYKRFADLSLVGTVEKIPNALSMIDMLIEDNSKVIDLLYNILETAKREEFQQVVSIVDDRIKAHEKALWMLKSTRK